MNKKTMTIIAISLIVIGVGLLIRQVIYRAYHAQDEYMTKEKYKAVQAENR